MSSAQDIFNPVTQGGLQMRQRPGHFTLNRSCRDAQMAGYLIE